jgi:hypothetical protein
MRAETWFSAEEAVAVGLADEVDTTSKRDGNVGNLEGITKHSITVPFSIDLQDIIDSAAQKIRETETIHVDTGLIEAGIQLAANNRPAADPPRPPVDERTTGADISAAILRGVGE